MGERQSITKGQRGLNWGVQQKRKKGETFTLLAKRMKPAWDETLIEGEREENTIHHPTKQSRDGRGQAGATYGIGSAGGVPLDRSSSEVVARALSSVVVCPWPAPIDREDPFVATMCVKSLQGRIGVPIPSLPSPKMIRTMMRVSFIRPQKWRVSQISSIKPG